MHPHGNRTEGDLNVLVISPLVDDREKWTEQRSSLDSGLTEGIVLLRSGDDDELARELRRWMQTDRYVSQGLAARGISSLVCEINMINDILKSRKKTVEGVSAVA